MSCLAALSSSLRAKAKGSAPVDRARSQFSERHRHRPVLDLNSKLASLGAPSLKNSPRCYDTGNEPTTMARPIYLDYASTTPTLPEVWEAMRAVPHGNPASAHSVGRQARRALEDARERVASLLNAADDVVIFTSGATEANNLAILGLAGDPPGHVVATSIEHPSVAEPLNRLSERGFQIDYLPVDHHGIADRSRLTKLVRPDTRLITVQLVNHETGAIQALGDGESRENAWAFRSALGHANPAIHTDAAQAVGKIPVQFRDLGVTALTVSGHKFGGPPGIGVLVLRAGAKVRPLLYGGHQQHGFRPGTESVSLAVGLAVALEIAVRDLKKNVAIIAQRRKRLLAALQAGAAPLTVNVEGIPHILNIAFPGCAADGLLMALDLEGLSCSAGSACSSGSLLPSPVLRAMGLPDDHLRSSIRISIGTGTTESDVDEAANRIIATVRRLRNLALD